MDWLQGDKFIGLADFVYSPQNKTTDDYDKSQNTFDLSKLKTRNIIYTHTMYVKQLFEIITGVESRFIIITHNSDVNIDKSFKLPDNIIKWYSQNVNVVDNRIKSIPIGIENDRWLKKVPKKEKMQEMLLKSKSCRNWAYMNHNIDTNPKERKPLYDLYQSKIWVTAESGRNGQNFDKYLENIYNHRYVFCPRGNGMDTHRFWECLYMGSVPIVKKDINNWFYNDIPVLYVNNWEEVTEELLADMWHIYRDGQWNKDKLTFNYWKNRIHE